MKLFCRFTTTLYIIIMTLGAYGQDNKIILQFIEQNRPFERQFVQALRNKDLNKCISFFTDNAIKSFGKDSLLSELKKISINYNDFPNPELEYSVGSSANGVGAFGHDVEGSLELECFYIFRNKKKDVVNSFRIYYTNKTRKGHINKFRTQASIQKELERYERIILIQKLCHNCISLHT